MDSTTKDELKIKEKRKLIDPSELMITNYDQMLKELILTIHDSTEDILKNLMHDNCVLAAYNIGMLHKTASNAIENFGIGHLFKEIEDKQ
jgi:hypothetical protein